MRVKYTQKVIKNAIKLYNSEKLHLSLKYKHLKMCIKVLFKLIAMFRNKPFKVVVIKKAI
jgi:hypothetical protein